MSTPIKCSVTHCQNTMQRAYATLRFPTQTTLVREGKQYASSSNSRVVYPICEECFEHLKGLSSRRRLVSVGALSKIGEEAWMWRQEK